METDRKLLDRQKLVAWLGRNILPHEASLRAWLRSAYSWIDVDDVVQEAYYRIARHEQIEHICDPRQYLFRTARNIVLEQVRRSSVVRFEAISNLASFEQSAAEDQISPERALDARRLLARVERLISALPDRTRRIFRLRKIEGLSQREIADCLSVSENIVENELSRGLKRILRSMTEAEREELPLRKAKAERHEQRFRQRK